VAFSTTVNACSPIGVWRICFWTYGTSILEKLYTILIPQFILHLNDGFIIPRKVLICHMHASEEKVCHGCLTSHTTVQSCHLLNPYNSLPNSLP